MFTKLPIPIDDGVPDGYSLIVAYGKGDTVVVPIDPCDLAEDNHNCDWEGCSTLHHVVRFSVLHKYAAEEARPKTVESPGTDAEQLKAAIALVRQQNIITNRGFESRSILDRLLSELEQRAAV